ncbi:MULTISPECIES: phosphatidate cytidylyltransferase [Sphaerochaeta]|jgi:phosphatidate cytidylyltransferase|uniref:Phosphatidate cytidylyltransferase n=3 Tax=root TaxID=1 RepID=A0ABY4DE28_9SPIR|nr:MULTISPECIES: phosphatidate cytidylyltransferase [Sphaerochaeta]MDT3358809.1 phosphatidate cytidylyltransferase [Spirochaetota bacterium]NCC66005.1 phosphatidate cytidylyltransferase [Spirochaetia bacterium]MDD3456357.1 phosphatidate cytidylyltransferase [Sphaerochaeta sp.]MDX9982939.1 phosphatidate cytidylyltransferase [Sphaerochaeta sp.]MEA5107680.1 phosphatidate cytidylyltransferase [Sphaerochaeta associata]
MTSMAKRVLTTVVTLPTLFCIILFLPHNSYMALSFLAMLTAGWGAKELKDLYQKSENVKVHLPSYVVGLLPLAQWLEMAYYPNLPLVDLAVVLMALGLFSNELYYGVKDSFQKSLSRIAAQSLLLLYPGLLITFIQRISLLAYPTQSFLLFFLLVFGNDIFAFVFGMSFGKNNKGFVKVSPNKSMAGFVGGTATTVLLSVLFCAFVPGIKDQVSLSQAILLGLATSTASNIGDLIESAFKRSAHMKDSGTLVPGRGGLLDSIDSMLASAPIFWILLSFF